MFRLAIPKAKWLTNKLREEKSSPAHHSDGCNNKKSIFDRAAYFRFYGLEALKYGRAGVSDDRVESDRKTAQPSVLIKISESRARKLI